MVLDMGAGGAAPKAEFNMFRSRKKGEKRARGVTKGEGRKKQLKGQNLKTEKNWCGKRDEKLGRSNLLLKGGNEAIRGEIKKAGRAMRIL